VQEVADDRRANESGAASDNDLQRACPIDYPDSYRVFCYHIGKSVPSG
jgi:hypothetical protein